jgi:hypothetical protein
MADIIGISMSERTTSLMNGSTRQDTDVYCDAEGSWLTYAAGYSYTRGCLAKLRSDAPASWRASADGERPAGESKSNAELHRIAQELHDVQRLHFYRLAGTVKHGNHNRTEIQVWCESGSGCTRCASSEEKRETDFAIAHEALKDFGKWILSNVVAEYEYRRSKEAVDEMIEANEYTFNEDGERA